MEVELITILENEKKTIIKQDNYLSSLKNLIRLTEVTGTLAFLYKNEKNDFYSEHNNILRILYKININKYFFLK
jgi:hypothetical protein